MVGPGLGLEVVSKVNGIPKGSRLAVSTNLLAAIIAVSMRATGQVKSLVGQLSEPERRVVAARAILGEWLGGSGGGWQDSGGVWPGLKMIEGQLAGPLDPEYGVSRGRLLPSHRIYTNGEVTPETRRAICDSFVLVHGGMAQNVGPILEMVTEKYLVRAESEWEARRSAMEILRSIEAALIRGDIQSLSRLTTDNFTGPIQAIIPWATNHYTQTLIECVRQRFGPAYWGFLMLGGMSGGGMGFIFDPGHKREGQTYLQELMSSTKRRLQNALPFAMEPVVYDFSINDCGTTAALLGGDDAFMPSDYYALCAPAWLRRNVRDMSVASRSEIERFASSCRTHPRLAGSVEMLFGRLFPRPVGESLGQVQLKTLLEENGFDPELHEQIRSDLRSGRIGLAQNRLPASTVIEDVRNADVLDPAAVRTTGRCRELGTTALAAGEVGVLTLAAGAGSRWTQGAGVVKALHPFCRFHGRFRNFIEIHLAKSRRAAAEFGSAVPHVVSTSYLTHDPIDRFLREHEVFGLRVRTSCG